MPRARAHEQYAKPDEVLAAEREDKVRRATAGRGTRGRRQWKGGYIGTGMAIYNSLPRPPPPHPPEQVQRQKMRSQNQQEQDGDIDCKQQ